MDGQDDRPGGGSVVGTRLSVCLGRGGLWMGLVQTKRGDGLGTRWIGIYWCNRDVVLSGWCIEMASEKLNAMPDSRECRGACPPWYIVMVRGK